MDNVPDSIYFKDKDSRFIRVNRALADRLGLASPGDAVGKSDADFFSAEHAEAALADEREVIRFGEPLMNVEEKETWPDGREHWVLTTKMPLRDAGEAIIGTFGYSRDITRRRQAEDALRQSERQWRQLTETCPDIICTVDRRGAILYINRVQPGLRFEDVLGKTVYEFIPAAHHDLARETLEKVFRTGEPASVEIQAVEPGGTVWWSSRLTPLEIEGDEPTAMVISTEISERKRIDEALRTSEERMRLILDAAYDAFVIMDDQGNIQFWNKQAEKIFGWPRGEIVGRSLAETIIPSNYRDWHARGLRRFFKTGEGPMLNRRLELTALRRDGREFPVEITITAIRLGSSHIFGSFLHDISERKRLDEERLQLLAQEQEARRELEEALSALRASESRFRRLFEAGIIGILFADTRGQITNANDAFLRMTGYERADLPLRYDLMTPAEQRPRSAEFLNELTAAGVATPFEKEYIRKNGSRVPVLIGAAMLEGSPDQVIAFVLDMTERNRMRSVLTLNDKLASIGLLSAGIAHEINNPLAFVANNLAVLERDFQGLMNLLEVYEGSRQRLAETEPEAARRVQAIAEQIDLPYIRANLDRILDRTRDGVGRVTRIVQSLRGLARTDRPQSEEVRLRDLLEMTLEMIRGRLKRRGIAVDADLETLPRVRCVVTQIGQVFLNLLVNAMQAIEATGRTDEGRIQVAGHVEDKTVVVTITDNGCGIPADDLPRIFDPFFTTKPVGEGTGLGLSITHNIITGHGGHIEVDSRPGEGSCFRITLPFDPKRGHP
jgi:PAS domain S-box-containing protein